MPAQQPILASRESPSSPSDSLRGAIQSHTTQRELQLTHSADCSAAANCFNDAGSNLPSFLIPGTQVIKVHLKPRGLVRAGGELTGLGSRLGLKPVLRCAMVPLPVRCNICIFAVLAYNFTLVKRLQKYNPPPVTLQ